MHYTSVYLKETSLPQFRKTNTDKKGYKFAICNINQIYWIALCLLCFYRLGAMFRNFAYYAPFHINHYAPQVQYFLQNHKHQQSLASQQQKSFTQVTVNHQRTYVHE